mmetsp:Transcript_25941/g.39438  ORF Transcript_25941/g.39438 Transcript_25941/m.39438 type:complete len:189 (-) Transcript_25941:403-969(-)|eukprot:CAMPEP_0194752348 /NCGR_PEP_ID=MMETSP0323_2-20130528/6116_1 /TAXON_ID=2866 ORGANISM="Crypthecodinium cohnii, Strain Seligo" /NCGR_SAMPLE_ID=MMETSP0323_2 /ASSEMBLY_ACC=CAM_ASM_000346 /LENGTH=188 /DNA_ID=CAMNT_0039669175 /DNA_START=14 /DNA_END=580 /DNA_ORIENTATION=-
MAMSLMKNPSKFLPAALVVASLCLQVFADEQQQEKDPGLDTANPVIKFVDDQPHQKWIAIAAAVIGALAVIGPSSFVRFFLSLFGSTVAGLFCASCYVFFTAPPASKCWLDVIIILLSGEKYNKVAYLIWLGVSALGLLRWITGWECGFYEVVDELSVEKRHVKSLWQMKKPLLKKNEGNAVAPRDEV